MNKNRTMAMAAALAFLTNLAFLPRSAQALSGTVSAAGLVSACEAGTVVLTANLKVEGGTGSSMGGCAVVVPADAAFEIVNASITFGGQFVVSGSTKSRVEVISSNVSASHVDVNLTGAESVFRVENGTLSAGSAGIAVDLATKALVRLVSAAGTDVLRTNGPLAINAGPTSLIELNQARIAAGSFSLGLNGTESVLKAEVSSVTATGSINVSSTGGKGLLELTSSTFSAGGSIDVTTNGTETVLKSSGTSLLAAGALTVSASPGSPKGLVEVLGANTVYQGTTVSMLASTGAGGEFGVIKLADGSTLRATVGNILVEVGASGTTELSHSLMFSPTRIDVLQGPGGKCVVGYWAPTAPFTMHCPNGSF